MMGIKERAFGPLPPVTLDDLIPPDHFYRLLEQSLDLSFVRAMHPTRVELSKLGPSAAALGAASLVLHSQLTPHQKSSR